MIFVINCNYYLCNLYKKDINLKFRLKIIDKLLAKLRKSIIIYQKNPFYT